MENKVNDKNVLNNDKLNTQNEFNFLTIFEVLLEFCTKMIKKYTKENINNLNKK